MKTYTIEAFEKKYGRQATTKVLELWGHQNIEHTELTSRCSYELDYYCGRCSNCNGVQCARITVKKRFKEEVNTII